MCCDKCRLAGLFWLGLRLRGSGRRGVSRRCQLCIARQYYGHQGMVSGMLPDPRLSRLWTSVAGGDMVKRKKIPARVLRARRRLWWFFPLLYAAGIFGFLGSRSWGPYALGTWAAGIMAFSLCVFPAVWWLSRREHRLYAKLISKRYALCPNCLYDLSGKSPDSERCPECGNVFDPTDWEGFVPIWFTCRRRRRVHPVRSPAATALAPSTAAKKGARPIAARRSRCASAPTK